MKKLTILFALLLALCVGASTASAQTAITTTTLSVAISNVSPTTFTITVASATGMAVNGTLWIDGSVYRIVAINSTTITVVTQYRPATHLTSATVFIVPIIAQYGGEDPVGSCIRGGTGQFPAASPFTIMFNVSNGNMATCRGAAGSRTWVITNQYATQQSNNPPATP